MSKKLIRCHTTDSDFIFDCTFNEPIEVNPYSEIALQSASFLIANQYLVVDASNEELTFQVQNGSPHTIRISNDTYTKHNSTRLLEAITKSMNKSLDMTVSKEHGTEIAVLATNDSRVQFDMKYAQQNVISSNVADQPMFFADPNLTIPTRGNNINITDDANIRTPSGSVDKNYIVGTVPFTKGCGNVVFRLTTYAVSGEVAKGAMGLVTKRVYEKYKEGGAGVTQADFDYFFEFPDSGQVDPEYGKSLTLGSHISMELTQGLLRFREYLADNSEQDIYTFPTPLIDENYDTDLYPVIIINSQKAEFKIKDLKYTPTPFVSSPTLENTEIQIDAITSTLPRPFGARPTVYNITFDSILLRDYLGFSQLSQNPLSTASVERNFTANQLFSNISSSDNYLVEMLNMKLDSYDSFTSDNVGGGRKNILSPIPISEQIIDNQTGLVQYLPHDMLYISLNNEFKLNLRNIRMRLVDTQYSAVNNAGFASLNIVIRDSR